MSRIVPIIMGSKKDLEFAEKIGLALGDFDIPCTYRIGSAHKTPEHVLGILSEYDGSGADVVYITVAGRGDMLSGFVAANSVYPSIACPPYSDKYAGLDILSSLRAPSAAPVLVCPEPENAAFAAAKIFAMKDEGLAGQLKEYMAKVKRDIIGDDTEVRKMK